jgi:hypothetical protein
MSVFGLPAAVLPAGQSLARLIKQAHLSRGAPVWCRQPATAILPGSGYPRPRTEARHGAALSMGLRSFAVGITRPCFDLCPICGRGLVAGCDSLAGALR